MRPRRLYLAPLLHDDNKLDLKVRSAGLEPAIAPAQNACFAFCALVPHTCTCASVRSLRCA